MNFDKKIEIAKHHQALQAQENANYILIGQLLAELIKRYPDTDLAVIKKHLVDLFFADKVKIYKRHTLNGDWAHLSHLTCLELGTKEFVPGQFLVDKQYFEELFTEVANRLTEPGFFCNTAFNLAEVEKTLGFDLASEPPVSESQELIIKDKRIAELETENNQLRKMYSKPKTSAESNAAKREQILNAIFILIARGDIELRNTHGYRTKAPLIVNLLYKHEHEFWPTTEAAPLSWSSTLKIIRTLLKLAKDAAIPNIEDLITTNAEKNNSI